MFAPLFNTRLAYSLTGQQFTFEPVVPIDRDLTFIWILWSVLLLVLVSPIVLFLLGGWVRRKRDILSSISNNAAVLYLRFFQGDSSKDIVQAVTLAEAAVATAETELAIAEANLVAARALTPSAPDPVVPATTAVASATNTLARARKKHEEQVTVACKKFVEYYHTQFGVALFIVPGLLLVALAGLLLLFPATLAFAELRNQPGQSGWAWVVGLAVLGGYTRVIYDLVVGMYQENIRPADLLWACYRLLISVPLGYTAGKLLDGSSTSVQLAPFVAFLLGLFPTYTVLDFGRRLFKKWTKESEFDASEPNQLRVMPAMDGTNAAVFEHEGLHTFTQLAYADPVRMSIRTGLGFSFVTTCASEAMLAMHLLRRTDMEKARKFGVCGAYEALGLWKRYREGLDPATLSVADQISQARAAAIVQQLAGELGFTQDGLKHILSLIAYDPYMEFIYEAWGSNLEWDG